MNATELSKAMAMKAATIAEHLLPDGKKVGHEWRAGSLAGEQGQSLGVHLKGDKAGVWSDFASGAKGDLLDLWAAVRGLSLVLAMDEARAFLGVAQMPGLATRGKMFRKPERPRGLRRPYAGVRDWLVSRGLTDDTLAAFRIGQAPRVFEVDGQKAERLCAVFPYLRDGVLVAVKYRDPKDKRHMQQETGCAPCLFGWHLIAPTARAVVICEGEIDAMTLHQQGIATLSVNAGAGNHQWIENDWTRLEVFSDIVIAFDHDEAGDKGAAEVMKRLGLERCRRAQLGAKDANQWLADGATQSHFRLAIHDAKPMDPTELVSAGKYREVVKAAFWPAPEATDAPVLELDRTFDWIEFRYGEVTVWTGINGHGKSVALSQVQLGLMRQGERVCVFSGEMQPKNLLKRMVKQATGLDRATPGYIDAVFDYLDARLYVFDMQGSAPMARLIEVFAYARRRYGVTTFVVDSLMTTDVPEDGPRFLTAQKLAMASLCDFAKANSAHVHLVAHPRKFRDESDAPGKMDVAGSSKIVDQADNLFAVWKAPKDDAVDPSAPHALLQLLKQRNGDVQTRKVWLWYDQPCMQFRTTPRLFAATRYVDFEGQPAPVPASTEPETRDASDEEPF